MAANRATNYGLILILAGYLLVAVLYAVYTPAWQAPDEPAHYNYIRQLADGKLPRIEPEDYDETYRREIVSSGFPPDYDVTLLTYEDWQPPLYYLLQTPVFLLGDGALLPLRLFSMVLGGGVIVLTFFLTRLLWPAQPLPVLTSVAFVAFLPQHVAVLASVNNDSLAELLIAILLFLLVKLTISQQRPRQVLRLWLLTGLVLGLGFLTKATVYIMAPVVGAAWLWWARGNRPLLKPSATRVLVPSLLLGGAWWLRNLIVYPGFDPLATAAHDAVVVGQARTASWLAQYGLGDTLWRFLRTSFQSFWGQFGWMGVVLDTRIYLLLFFLTLFLVAGFLWAIFRSGMRHGIRGVAGNGAPYTAAALLLTLTFAGSVLLFVGYNLTFVQHQGRYLFPALLPIASAVGLGLLAWTRPFLHRWSPIAWLLPLLFSLSLVALDLVALFRFIVPQLS